MKQTKLWGVFILLLAGVFALSYFGAEKPREPKKVSLPEIAIHQLELDSPIFGANSEFSGMAWHGEDLILLPQHPDVFDIGNGEGYLFYIPKEQITDYLDGRDTAPLEAGPLRLVAPELKALIPDFQGFEAIGFSGDRAFLTIEAGKGKDMHGYLISGLMSPDRSKLLLDTSRITEIPTQADSETHADESILILEDKILTFYEALGKEIVPNPVAHVFNFDLNSIGTIPMTNLEYRLTDTALADGNIFWGINSFSHTDKHLLPQVDPIYEKYGTGETHAEYEQIERLVAFEYSDSGITLAKIPPVMLKLAKDARNWEGLALLDDRGFLIVTDQTPATLMGFIPFP